MRNKAKASLWLLLTGFNHHYVPYRIEVDEMLPYLSKEAQKLIQAKGDIAKYGFGDWSLGKRLGEAETVDGDEVVLMQRMPRWGFEEHEYEESIFEDNEDGDSPEVIAYSIKDGLYVPSESRYKTLAFIGETKDCLIRIDNIGDTYRYAVWKHKFNMDDEPDLVVNNGWFDSEGAYVFENNGYGYMVEAVQTSFVTPNLYVYHGKKQLSKQPLTILEECYENTNIEFLPLGKVTGSDGSTIRLVKCVQTAYGASVSYNYFLKALSGGDVPVEKKIFETTTPTGEKCYQANTNTISSHSQWVSTSPDGGYYAFNEEDNTLYCVCDQDLFEVYQFDGTHFNFVRKAGGFWLHPCLRSFVRLVNIYETKGFVIRVDKTGEEGNNCRYAVWKKGTESYPGIMAQSPDLVIDNGQLDNVMIGSSEYNVSKFEDEGYQYIVDESKRELTVNKGKNLVLKQKIENILIN